MSPRRSSRGIELRCRRGGAGIKVPHFRGIAEHVEQVEQVEQVGITSQGRTDEMRYVPLLQCAVPGTSVLDLSQKTFLQKVIIHVENLYELVCTGMRYRRLVSSRLVSSRGLVRGRCS